MKRTCSSRTFCTKQERVVNHASLWRVTHAICSHYTGQLSGAARKSTYLIWSVQLSEVEMRNNITPDRCFTKESHQIQCKLSFQGQMYWSRREQEITHFRIQRQGILLISIISTFTFDFRFSNGQNKIIFHHFI